MHLAAKSILLASTSPYRRQLLQQIGITATCIAPETDESALPGEPPHETAKRLSEAKAHSVLERHTETLVIAGDQTASLNGDLLRKPINLAGAVKQLQSCSGHTVDFFSAVTTCTTTDTLTEVVTTRVHFRTLTEEQIAFYLEREQPFDCVGSFKCEGLGIALFERIESSDPSALIGLPLISITRMLGQHGMDILEKSL